MKSLLRSVCYWQLKLRGPFSSFLHSEQILATLERIELLTGNSLGPSFMGGLLDLGEFGHRALKTEASRSRPQVATCWKRWKRCDTELVGFGRTIVFSGGAALQKAIDDMAGELTGNREYFLNRPHGIG